MKMPQYAPNLFQYQRRKTREVMVGDVGIGGNNPIRVQSMTISDTLNTPAVVKEAIGLIEAGCEIVRITAPTIHHAENLKSIRDELRKRGYKTPLVADIHFTPQAAMIAAEIVEKVRINPGNFADRKLFAVKEYTDSEYESELQRMADKFIPLVRRCKERGIAMRIGTNHGSLSDRIMNRFGDTPLGMVESALEFVRICESEDYQDLIISMKASSPFIMIQAYRQLAQRMAELGMDYPFHLGVTEAGEGEDGRVKSAIGIGSLLEDGIGDTIRVSLTEDSIYEIPVAQQLVKKYNARSRQVLASVATAPLKISWNPLKRQRRESKHIFTTGLLLGGNYSLGVVSSFKINPSIEKTLQDLEGFAQARKVDDPICDILTLIPAEGQEWEDLKEVRDRVRRLFPKIKVGVQVDNQEAVVSSLNDFDAVVWLINEKQEIKNLTVLAQQARDHEKILELRFSSLELVAHCQEDLVQCSPILLSLSSASPVYDYRRLVTLLDQKEIRLPIHLVVNGCAMEDSVLEASSQLGSLLMDGIGDSIQIEGLSLADSIRLGFNILQASRLRISKAEFIACPSCGRTLFDLQTTTQRIKSKTGHLKGVKIAIMGCIVNGPGEMADADFGYVGGGPGRIHLYVGKECVEKNIDQGIADQKLIELIKKHGRWVDPPAA